MFVSFRWRGTGPSTGSVGHVAGLAWGRRLRHGCVCARVRVYICTLPYLFIHTNTQNTYAHFLSLYLHCVRAISVLVQVLDQLRPADIVSRKIPPPAESTRPSQARPVSGPTKGSGPR